MTNDYNLAFLRSKISQTGSALCSFHLAGLKHSSYIVHTNNVNENGEICFNLINSFPNFYKEDLSSFRLNLFFYKKGLGYHLKIEASATANQAILQTEANTREDQNILHVKAKILSAEYTEGQEKIVLPGIFYSVRKRLANMAATIF